MISISLTRSIHPEYIPIPVGCACNIREQVQYSNAESVSRWAQRRLLENSKCHYITYGVSSIPNVDRSSCVEYRYMGYALHNRTVFIRLPKQIGMRLAGRSSTYSGCAHAAVSNMFSTLTNTQACQIYCMPSVMLEYSMRRVSAPD